MFKFTLLFASFLLPTATAQDDDPNHGVVFIYPTEGHIYNYMDTVNVTYTSPFPTPNLYLFCDGGGREVSRQRALGYNASIPVVLNFTSATPCWFNLRPGTLPGYGANSPSFIIIGQERGTGSIVFGPSSESPSSTSTSTPTTSNGETVTSSTDGVNAEGSRVDAGTSSQADNLAPGNNSSALSAGAAAGIGVGVAVAILAVAGGIFALWWRRKRPNGRENQYQPYDSHSAGLQGGPSGNGTAGIAFHQDHIYHEKRAPAELSSTPGVSEIATSQTQYNQQELQA
ncbi:hypothetical protein VTK26DRAFT_6507 [Humicola hyalothermophila]